MTTPPDTTRARTPLPPPVRGAIALGAVLVVGWLLIRAGDSREVIPAMEANPHGQEIPEHAPAFSLPDRDGVAHTLDELAGRPVLINFWATWCPPCLDEMPALQRMIAALGDTDLAVVAISLDESWEPVGPVLEQTGFGEGALLLLDPDRAVAQSYGTFKVPETYLIARDGRILHRYQGAKAWDSEAFLNDLRAFISGELRRSPELTP